MDEIKKALVFNGAVKVTALITTDIVNKAIELHNLTPLTATVLGKLLTVGAYMSNELKGKFEKLSINIKCEGALSGAVVAADQGGKVRGYVLNPKLCLPVLGNGKQNTMKAIEEGKITVIKDLGLKECYSGHSEIVNGSIDADFAWYFTVSEGQNTAIALSVVMNNNKCVAAGGIIVQPLPSCSEHILIALEDIVTNFADIDKLITKKDAYHLIDDYFGHFEIEYFDSTFPEYVCKCSKEVIELVILSMGRNECVNILLEREEIEVECHFCNKKYKFNKQQVIDIWRRYDEKTKQ